jgi:upstream activation factor subunit UAF30
MAKKKVAKKAVAKKTAKKAAPKATAKAAGTKKAATKAKPAAKAKGKSASGGGFMKALELSEELGSVIGSAAVPRTEVIKKLWVYIKKHGLQDPKNKRNILADDKLKAVFGKPVVNMFEMAKLVGKHLK